VDPEGAFYDSFIDEEIVKAIEALPAEYRAAVLMSDVHGMRYAEIATILGVPEGTVKSRLFRGRRMLQRRLKGYAQEMGYVKVRGADAGAQSAR
jgi:RNA polymerase sigma-70 factor (ECF subfamily)